jgi:hypothetical protein
MMKTIASVAGALALLAGCATAPDQVEPTYVSQMQYEGLTCDQLRAEIQRIANYVHATARAEARDRRRDEVAWGVGLVVFWPALLFVGAGSDKEALADFKGQYMALDETAQRKGCEVAAEVRAGQAAAAAAGSQIDPSGPIATRDDSDATRDHRNCTTIDGKVVCK